MILSRFNTLWQRNAQGISQKTITTQSTSVFVALCHKYQEPHRIYHNFDHIKSCLRAFDSARNDIINHDAVELAIWFHDVIYQVSSHQNEINSALYFDRVSDGILNNALRTTVHELILQTTHKTPPTHQDEKILVDIDLSSFAASRAHFEKDGEKIRKEQSHLSDQAFFQKQIAFQEALLKRKHFFYSDFFFVRFEEQARDNLTRHIKYLKSIDFQNNCYVT